MKERSRECVNETMKEQRHRFGVGKSMTKHKGIIAQSAQHNRNVLINERSIKDRGNIGGVKGASNVRNNKNRNHTKEG